MDWLINNGELAGMAVFSGAMILYYVFERRQRLAGCILFVAVLWLSLLLDARVPVLTLDLGTQYVLQPLPCARITGMVLFLIAGIIDLVRVKRRSKALFQSTISTNGEAHGFHSGR